MPDWTVHPDAATALNSMAANVAAKIICVPTKLPERPRYGFQPDVDISGEITSKDIVKPYRSEMVDARTGVVTAIHFDGKAGPVGLFGADCVELERLVDRLARIPPFRSPLGRNSIRKHFLDWLEATVREESTVAFTDYLVDRLQETVRDHEVWIPISRLYVESDLPCGRVLLRPVTSAKLLNWRTQATARLSEDRRATVLADLADEWKSIQGLAAATVTVIADSGSALDQALVTAEQSIALLRFYHPANLSPAEVSYVRPIGRENLERVNSFLLSREGDLLHHIERVLPPLPMSWVLDSSTIAEMRSHGLDQLRDLDARAERTEFQDALVEALLIYARQNLAKNTVEKAIFIFAALEAMLIQNETEPIQQNIADRLALVVGQSLQERRAIARSVKKCYGLRSRFLHHGDTSGDSQELEGLMRCTWSFFRGLIVQNDRFVSKADLLNQIENVKFSSPADR
jgi:hypothetical protein